MFSFSSSSICLRFEALSPTNLAAERCLSSFFYFSVPPNVKFEIDDFEDEWTFSRPFDYIHSRMNNSSIANWEDFVRRSYEYVSPIMTPQG